MTFACCSSPTVCSRIANSSPPRRASVSPSRRHDSRRRDTAISISSPTRWPRLSFTTLKRSRSRYRIANRPPPRCGCLNSSRRRPSTSTKSARLRRPVNGSRKPALRSCCCASAWSVMSVSDPAMRTGVRPAPRACNTAAQERPVGPVFLPDAVLVLKMRRRARQVRFQRFLQRRRILWMHAVEPFLGTSDARFAGKADDFAPPRREVELLRAKIPLPPSVVRALGRQREALFAALQCWSALRSFGDVVPEQRQAVRRPEAS